MDIRQSITFATLLSLAATVHASPVGLWRTQDDRTEEPRAIVEIAEQDGALVGRIVEVLDPGAPQDARCALCTDERRDAPIVGLTIIRNVQPNGRANGPWDGGDILDPNDGKVYRVRLKLAEGGRRLEVRGYLGTPLLGRTQIWHRVD